MTSDSNSSINSYLSMFKPASLNMDDEDIMYNSLRRLSTTTVKTPIKKPSTSYIPFKTEDKKLDFTLNDIYHTDGKSEIQKVDNRKILSKKTIKSIGTCLEYFVLSDMISIDIDPDSTRLPLMCKLMIIVEGAAKERGTRNLVRDAGVQTNDEVDIYIHVEEKDNQKSNKKHELKFNTLERHRSSESITHEAYNELYNKKKSTSRLLTGGSMSNLNLPTLSISEESSYFNKTSRSTETEAKRLERLDRIEHAATPYYQYIRTNIEKNDFSSYVNEECFEKVQVHKATSTSNINDEVEVLIPIKIVPETHRNEKHIFIDNNSTQLTLQSDFYIDDIERMNILSQNMRRYFDERLNRFEAEISFYNLKDGRMNEPIFSFTESNHPVSYSYHIHQCTSKKNQQHQQIYQQVNHVKRSEPSVTNMMVMHIVDGQIID